MDWRGFVKLSLAFLVFGGLGWAGYRYVERLPSNLKPWAAPDLDAPAGRWARIQLNRLGQNPALCRSVLEKTTLRFTPIADRPSEKGCVLDHVMRYDRGRIAYSASFLASCPLAAALYWYEQKLDETAQKHFGSGVARIHHAGSYACRNVNSAKEGNLSQHATANAIDITGFTLADGTNIDVTRDWKDSRKAAFLRAARKEACRFFNAVLSPDYNKLHATHFHLDMGPAWICR